MSWVTNVILLFHIQDTYPSKPNPIVEINNWLEDEDNDYGPFRGNVAKCDACCGGYRVGETPVYFGAFNHFPIDDFVEMIKKAKWSAPEAVQILYKGQEDDKFTMIEPFA
jgi:hypothetical protein